MEENKQPNLSDEELNSIFDDANEPSLDKVEASDVDPLEDLGLGGGSDKGGGLLQAEKVDFPELGGKEGSTLEHSGDPDSNINLLLDIPMTVSVELGRSSRLLKEILNLSVGSIIELDKLSGEPVDLLVNGRIIAKAEVVVIDENFGVRITQIIDPKERIKS